MAYIIDGKKVSATIKEELKETVSEYTKANISITLAVIQVGKDPASTVYVGKKKKTCEYIGINSLAYELDENVSEEELLNLIVKLNNDEKVNGILVQLPLPKHIDEDKVIKTIDPRKDVDGFHPQSVGALSIGQKGYVSCTPAGIIQLLKRSNIEIEGKECVIVGRSNIVGKPMALLMLRENATVTVCHSRTKDLKEVTKRADILIVAIGKPKFITKEYVKGRKNIYSNPALRDYNTTTDSANRTVATLMKIIKNYNVGDTTEDEDPLFKIINGGEENE